MSSAKVILISSLILWLSFSCTETLTEHPAIRRIINETNHDGKLKIFSKNGKFEYKILSSDTLNIKGVCFRGIESFCDLGISQWGEVDSASFSFSNMKIQKFKLSGDYEAKVIYGDPNGESYGYTRDTEDDGGIITYIYRLTQEDYENAKDCNGHPRCD